MVIDASILTTPAFNISNASPGLIVIGGPTATGKSALALAMAQALGTVIISADSRQVYRGFDIGTAKPSVDERALVPHFLIDSCDPWETLTLGDYQDQANAIIQDCHDRGQTPILVGGTGLYLKAIVQGLTLPRVPPHPSLRSSLTTLGQFHCHQLLQHLDPIAAQRIHPNDHVRTLRALEVYYVTGHPISQQQGESPPTYPLLYLGIMTQNSEQLRQRIQTRTQTMWDQGFVEEVRQLQARYGADLPLLQTLGYQEVGRYLAGEISEAEAQTLTVQHTCQFAKRQRTWFRSVPTIQWLTVNPETPTPDPNQWWPLLEPLGISP